MKRFLNSDPELLVKSVTIEILETAGGQEDFELTEVLLYELVKEDDMKF